MTTKREILKTIRTKCLECCGGSEDDVKMCTSNITNNFYTACPLYNFRFGTDPKPNSAKVKQGKRLSKSSKSTE